MLALFSTIPVKTLIRKIIIKRERKGWKKMKRWSQRTLIESSVDELGSRNNVPDDHPLRCHSFLHSSVISVCDGSSGQSIVDSQRGPKEWYLRYPIKICSSKLLRHPPLRSNESNVLWYLPKLPLLLLFTHICVEDFVNRSLYYYRSYRLFRFSS